METGQFIINGIDNHGIRIAEFPQIGGFERDTFQEHVIGLSGDLIDDMDSYKNKNVTIKFYKLGKSLSERVQNEAYITKLFTQSGYSKMILWYDTEHYRLLKPIATPHFFYDVPKYNSYFEVEFSVHPMRYDTAENKFTLREHGVIQNPYNHSSKPLIKIYGSGTIRLVFNNEAFEIENVNGRIEVDCELYKVYRDDENQNDRVRSIDFPILQPGGNVITWSGNVEYIEVYGRFNTL